MNILLYLLIRLLGALEFVILAQCIASWIPNIRDSKIYWILNSITEPIEGPIREILYRYVSIPVDFSPVIALVLIQIAQNLIYIIAR